jgi:hypothetical protein
MKEFARRRWIAGSLQGILTPLLEAFAFAEVIR